jgi:DNA (cytosine-5)-methyltransferase 1
MNGLDLFSGIGGLSIALKPWIRPIAYCENDKYAQANLLSRMWSGELTHAPIWDDVRTLQRDSLGSWVDIIYGGFPCQDISVAGDGAGLAGERSGLFFEIVRLAEETRAPFVFLENVPAIRTRGLREVVRAFADLGYDCRWTRISAAEVRAPHLRERWFLLAHSNSSKIGHESGWGCGSLGEGKTKSRHDGREESLANSLREGLERQWGKPIGAGAQFSDTCDKSWWTTEPNVGRVANGVSLRVDRLRGLGNAVVPAQAREAFKRLMGVDQ